MCCSKAGEKERRKKEKKKRRKRRKGEKGHPLRGEKGHLEKKRKRTSTLICFTLEEKKDIPDIF
jgi:hypothetical protein